MTMTTDGRQAVHAFVEREHAELTIGIDRIHDLAVDLPSMSVDRIPGQVDGVIRWLDHTLKPHLTWEEMWLFPQIDDRARTPWATRTARFDHRQIAHRIERMASHRRALEHGVSHETTEAIRADLYGLEVLVLANLERVDELLLPLLDRDADRGAPEWHD